MATYTFAPGPPLSLYYTIIHCRLISDCDEGHCIQANRDSGDTIIADLIGILKCDNWAQSRPEYIDFHHSKKSTYNELWYNIKTKVNLVQMYRLPLAS